MRPFRFGYQTRAADAGQLRHEAQAAEDAGFDVVCTFDHLGENFSALAPLAFAAAWTSSIRVCPLVLNNDFHHPALLAQELASLDRLSEGRLEVGIGAGHAFTEYAAAGLDFDPPAIRKARLAESVEILRRLLDGQSVTLAGSNYQLAEAAVIRPAQTRVPILVGVNGQRALAHAAAYADIVAPTMLGRTLPDGQRHEVRWEAERLDATIAWIRAHSAERTVEPEINALVQAVTVTNDRPAAAEELRDELGGLSVADILATPFLAIGTHDQIAEHLLACRARWGISYYVVRDIDSFAPIIERLRRADNTAP